MAGQQSLRGLDTEIYFWYTTNRKMAGEHQYIYIYIVNFGYTWNEIYDEGFIYRKKKKKAQVNIRTIHRLLPVYNRERNCWLLLHNLFSGGCYLIKVYILPFKCRPFSQGTSDCRSACHIISILSQQCSLIKWSFTSMD